MKTLLKIAGGTIVLLLAFAILAGPAWTRDPESILKGKKELTEGSCMMTKEGLIAESKDETAYIRDCVIGADPKTAAQKRYAAIYDSQGDIEAIIELDRATQKQKVIWVKGEKDI